jgi:Na+/proline symporter
MDYQERKSALARELRKALMIIAIVAFNWLAVSIILNLSGSGWGLTMLVVIVVGIIDLILFLLLMGISWKRKA